MEEIVKAGEVVETDIQEKQCGERIDSRNGQESAEMAPDTDDLLNNDKLSANESEYETLDSEDDSSEHEQVHKNRRNDSANELGSQNGNESDTSLGLEREEGDGQESMPNRKVDDDEDKKNPQYIPKRGTFYEHDDRTAEDGEQEESTDKPEKVNKKNIWIEKKERWSHDRFNDNEQAPKSRAELISIYGYDIRNEEGAPRARRRRRYGRGPNKYTRNWEDEDAYRPAKPVRNVVRKSKNQSDEEFPPLVNESGDSEQREQNVNSENESNNLENYDEEQDNRFSSTKSDSPPSKAAVYREESNTIHSATFQSDGQPKNYQTTVVTGRISKPKHDIQVEVKKESYIGFTRSRQYRNSNSEQKILPKLQKRTDRNVAQTQNSFSNRNIKSQHTVHDVEADLNQLNIQDSSSRNTNRSNNLRQTSVPPRLQSEQKGSKRYSSLRQRSLPETAGPPFSQLASFYPNDYPQQNSSPPQQQSILQQPAPLHPIPTQVSQIPPPPLPSIPQQIPVSATQILQAPPQYTSPFPQAPTFLQPAVPAAAFIPPPPPTIINYVQGQPQFPQAPFQGFQHQQFNAVNQAAEVCQMQGGTTYYLTQGQHIGQRFVPVKRPKAAIPIVPPPPQEPRGRGRSVALRDTPSPADETTNNIVYENSNHYEDATVIVQQ